MKISLKNKYPLPTQLLKPLSLSRYKEVIYCYLFTAHVELYLDIFRLEAFPLDIKIIPFYKISLVDTETYTLYHITSFRILDHCESIHRR